MSAKYYIVAYHYRQGKDELYGWFESGEKAKYEASKKHNVDFRFHGCRIIEVENNIPRVIAFGIDAGLQRLNKWEGISEYMWVNLDDQSVAALTSESMNVNYYVTVINPNTGQWEWHGGFDTVDAAKSHVGEGYNVDYSFDGCKLVEVKDNIPRSIAFGIDTDIQRLRKRANIPRFIWADLNEQSMTRLTPY